MLSIKANYHHRLTPDLLHRLAAFPKIIFDNTPISEDLSQLAFIAPTKEMDSDDRWRNINIINALVSNYNLVLALLNERNQLHEELIEKLTKEDIFNFAETNLDVLKEIVGSKHVGAEIDLTEKVITILDHVLSEVNDFLANFPESAKSCYDKKKIGNSIKPIYFQPPEDLLGLEESSIEPDYNQLAEFYNTGIEEAIARYSSPFGH